MGSENSLSGRRAHGVEQCECPPGYTGLSCQVLTSFDIFLFNIPLFPNDGILERPHFKTRSLCTQSRAHKMAFTTLSTKAVIVLCKRLLVNFITTFIGRLDKSIWVFCSYSFGSQSVLTQRRVRCTCSFQITLKMALTSFFFADLTKPSFIHTNGHCSLSKIVSQYTTTYKGRINKKL